MREPSVRPPVRDVDDGHAFGAQRADDFQQFVGTPGPRPDGNMALRDEKESTCPNRSTSMAC